LNIIGRFSYHVPLLSAEDLSWEPLLFAYQGPRRCTVLVWCT
jgi:hypothetical protein